MKSGKIMVVRKKRLFPIKDQEFQGFYPVGKIDFAKRVLRSFEWMKRSLAETDESYKQPVPYILIFNKSTKKFFVYRRSAKGNEDRLHARMSMGIGGHVDLEDRDAAMGSPVYTAMLRELREEVIVSLNSVRLLGFINIDNIPVNRVHFGFCYLIETESDVEINENALEEGGMLSLEEMENIYDGLEDWSKIAFSYAKKLFSDCKEDKIRIKARIIRQS